MRTESKTNEIQTIQQRSPVSRNGIGVCLGIPNSKLMLVGRHGLASRKALIVEAIVETGERNQTNGRCQTGGEMRQYAVPSNESMESHRACDDREIAMSRQSQLLD